MNKSNTNIFHCVVKKKNAMTYKSTHNDTVKRPGLFDAKSW